MASDPFQPEKRQSLIGPLIALAILIADYIFVGWFFSLHGLPSMVRTIVNIVCSIVAVSCALVIMFGSIAWVRNRSWQRHQRSRREAEERGMLAAEQPVQNANALTLPVKLEIGVGLGAHAWMETIFGPLLLWLLSFSVLGALANGLLSSTALGWLAFSGFYVLMVAFVHWAINTGRYGVMLTEEGICHETASQANAQMIKWEDARFFSLRGKGTGWSPLYYELSSDYGKIRWMHLLQSSQKRLSMYRSLAPFDEYERDAGAALEVIAGKTGLPLYDMRKPRHKRPLI